MSAPTENTRVHGFDTLPAPEALNAELPATEATRRTVLDGRAAIQRVLRGQDNRFLVIVGPCSIHDVDAALEYARRLKALADDVADRILVVMRAYFEKPRTTVGWKGLINDPFLYSNQTFDMATGLRKARRLLLDINGLGLPCGTEFLDPFTPQYLDDGIAWAAIGARTTESQTHRQMASGLSMPVGFKNATTGGLQVALDAMQSAGSAHHFLGIDDAGRAAVVHTRGNPDGHVILRGGNKRSNYAPADIADARDRLEAAGLPGGVMVDCSHANSGKKFENQPDVWRSLLEQRAAGDASPPTIVGAMLESNLNEGNQKVPNDPADLKPGVSITDACIGWEATDQLLREAHAALG